MQKRREKQNKKKQTSRIADNSRKSEKIRTKKRVLPLPDCAKCAKVRTKKRACCLFRDFRGPKRRCAPRSGRHPGRSGVPDVELLQNVAQKRGYPRTGGYPRHRPGSAGSLNRAKVCSKKRPVVPDRNGSPADRGACKEPGDKCRRVDDVAVYHPIFPAWEPSLTDRYPTSQLSEKRTADKHCPKNGRSIA